MNDKELKVQAAIISASLGIVVGFGVFSKENIYIVLFCWGIICGFILSSPELRSIWKVYKGSIIPSLFLCSAPFLVVPLRAIIPLYGDDGPSFNAVISWLAMMRYPKVYILTYIAEFTAYSFLLTTICLLLSFIFHNFLPECYDETLFSTKRFFTALSSFGVLSLLFI